MIAYNNLMIDFKLLAIANEELNYYSAYMEVNQKRFDSGEIDLLEKSLFDQNLVNLRQKKANREASFESSKILLEKLIYRKLDANFSDVLVISPAFNLDTLRNQLT